MPAQINLGQFRFLEGCPTLAAQIRTVFRAEERTETTWLMKKDINWFLARLEGYYQKLGPRNKRRLKLAMWLIDSELTWEQTAGSSFRKAAVFRTCRILLSSESKELSGPLYTLKELVAHVSQLLRQMRPRQKVA